MGRPATATPRVARFPRTNHPYPGSESSRPVLPSPIGYSARVNHDHELDTAVFDVDGTLVDTNYQHALAWFRAFRRYGMTVPVWRLHRAIGMGATSSSPP